jgi:hypothetical protein
MIGRFSMVFKPTSTSKKSARWLIWKPSSRTSAPRPARPARQATWRDTKAGVNLASTRNGVARLIS